MQQPDALDRLRVSDVAAFVAAADSGSLSKAALAQGCSQSMLSRRVQELEQTLGGRLFSRTGRGIVPTELGAALLAPARALLSQAGDFMALAASSQEDPTGTVVLTLPSWAAGGQVSDLVNRVRALYPRIRLVIHEGYSRTVLERLNSGEIDLGVFNSPRPAAPANAQLLFSSELILVGRRGSPLVRTGTVPLAALRDVPLAMPAAPNPVMALVREVSAGLDIRLKVDLEVNSGPMILDVVLNSGRYGISMIHGLGNPHTLRELGIARIVAPSLEMHTFCGTSAKHLGTRARRLVEACLVQILRERHAEAMRLLDHGGAGRAAFEAARSG